MRPRLAVPLLAWLALAVGEKVLYHEASDVTLRVHFDGAFTLEYDAGEEKSLTVVVDPVYRERGFPTAADRNLVVLVTSQAALNASLVKSLIGGTGFAVVPEGLTGQLTGIDFRLYKGVSSGEKIAPTTAPLDIVALEAVEISHDQCGPDTCVGWLIYFANGMKLYISGDTKDTPAMRALRGVDHAFISLVSNDEAADAVVEFSPRVVYPYRYRRHNETTLQGEQRRSRFVDAVQARKPTIDVEVFNWYPSMKLEDSVSHPLPAAGETAPTPVDVKYGMDRIIYAIVGIGIFLVVMFGYLGFQCSRSSDPIPRELPKTDEKEFESVVQSNSATGGARA